MIPTKIGRYLILLFILCFIPSCSQTGISKPRLGGEPIVNPVHYNDETKEIQFIIKVENDENLSAPPIIIVSMGINFQEIYRENALLVGDENAVMPLDEQSQAYHRYNFRMQTAYVNRMKSLENGNYEAKLILTDNDRSLRSIFGEDFKVFIVIEDKKLEMLDKWEGRVEYLQAESPDSEEPKLPTYGRISYGDTVTGHLSTKTQEEMQLSWIFKGQKDDLVTIESRITDDIQSFEPIIFLFDQNDNKLSESTRSGTGVVHKIDKFKLPNNGTFRIQVGWQGPPGDGNFELSLQRDNESGKSTNELCNWTQMLIGTWSYKHPDWTHYVVFQPGGMSYGYHVDTNGKISDESQSRWTCLEDGQFKDETAGSVYRITVDQSHWVINNDTWTRVSSSEGIDLQHTINTWLGNRCKVHPPTRWMDAIIQLTDTGNSFGFHVSPDGDCELSNQSIQEADIIMTIDSKDLIALLEHSVAYSTLVSTDRISIQYSGLWGQEEGRGFLTAFLDFLLFENSK
jgi:hypothetical protein